MRERRQLARPITVLPDRSHNLYLHNAVRGRELEKDRERGKQRDRKTVRLRERERGLK